MKNKDFVLPHDYFQTKYGVGNYVRIRENLEVGKKYNGLLWLPQMDNYKGKIYKIKHSFYSSVYKRYFLENIDYEFSEEMLEEINPIKKKYYKEIYEKNV